MENSNADTNQNYVIFVGNVKIIFDEPKVKASNILLEYGEEDPANYILLAIKGKNGESIKSYEPSDIVDLTEKHHKFFRTQLKGGGRA